MEDIWHRRDWIDDPVKDLPVIRIMRMFADTFGLETARVGLMPGAQPAATRSDRNALVSRQDRSPDTGAILLEVDMPMYTHGRPVGTWRWILDVDDSGRFRA